MIEYENLARLNEPFNKELNKTFDDVLKSGWFILGEKVKKFESEFAKYLGAKYSCGVASGLDALTIALLALDIPKGSEIVVPSNTYIATILSIIQAGHKPVLVEPDIRTYNIDPLNIESAVTPKTRAVMIVHLYGKPCDMDPITAVCRKNNLRLIEDCAQSHGAEYKGKKTGCFGDISGFSFYPTKNLGCIGDGGAVVTNTEELYLKARIIRNYGSEKKYYNEVAGMNSRLDEIQAAFLSVKLKYLDKLNNHKRKLAAIYLSNLKSDFVLPAQHEDFYDVFHIFNVRHQKRDSLKEYLKKNNILTEIHYPLPPHRQKALSFLADLSFPVSEEIHRTTLSLPVSSIHTPEDIYRIVEVLNRF